MFAHNPAKILTSKFQLRFGRHAEKSSGKAGRGSTRSAASNPSTIRAREKNYTSCQKRAPQRNCAVLGCSQDRIRATEERRRFAKRLRNQGQKPPRMGIAAARSAARACAKSNPKVPVFKPVSSHWLRKLKFAPAPSRGRVVALRADGEATPADPYTKRASEQHEQNAKFARNVSQENWHSVRGGLGR